MSFQLPIKSISLAALLALSPLVGAAPAEAAPVPGLTCGEGFAKTVATCLKKAIAAEAGCFKKTGAACLAGDTKMAAAFAGAAKGIGAKCKTSTDIQAAGFGSYSSLTLGNYASDLCKRETATFTTNTFGTGGARYTAADATGKACLQSAAKVMEKSLSGAIGGLAKCLPKATCSFDFSATATATATALDTACPTFATVIGSTTADYVALATDQIPRSVKSPCDAMDASACVFPFPNDYFTMDDSTTATGKRLAFGRNTLPATGGGKAVDPARWNSEIDGFSIGAMILFNDVNIDLAQTGAAPITDIAKSLDANSPIVLLDAETGEHQLMWMERDQRGATVADQPLIGRVGRNLKEGHRYIFAMRNMKNASGSVIPASPIFAAFRDNTPTSILPVEARRAHMEEVLTTLAGFGITRSELYMAWDFTTQSAQSTSSKLLAMRDDAFATLGDSAPDFTVDSVTTHTVVENADIFREVDGTFQVPLYLTNHGVSGSSLIQNANGVPQQVVGETYTAHYRCEIPHAATTGDAAPAVPARISLYGHGLLGSHTEVGAGNVQDFAQEHNIIFCATDWTGFADDDYLYVGTQVLSDFSKFPNFIDRQHQGILNAMFLGRLMLHAEGLSTDPAFQLSGVPLIDNSALFYDGNSQGGILGGVLAAFEQDATRFALGVPGINYSTLLNRSVDFNPFNVQLATQYLTSTGRNTLLAVAQIMWDRTDPSGHIHHVLSDPYAGTPAKKVLYQLAFGDHQVAPVTVEVAARSNGASIHTPVVVPGKVVPDVTPYYDIPAIASYPFDGSAMVVWDAGNPAAPTGDIPPANITPSDAEWSGLSSCAQNYDPVSGEGGDPHSCPRKTVAARTQKSEFLKIGGAIVDVCGGAACVVP